MGSDFYTRISNQNRVWISLILTFGLLLLPNFLLLIFERHYFSWERLGETLGAALFLWLLLLVCLRNVWIFFIVILPVLWIMPLETIYIVNYSRASDIHIFGILSDTTFDEAFEYIKSYIICFVFYLAIVSWTCFRFAGFSYKNEVKLPSILIWSVIVSSVFALFFLLLGNYLLSQQEKEYQLDHYVTFNANGDNVPLLFGSHHNLIEGSFVDSFPFGLFLRAIKYQEQVSLMAELRRKTESFKFGVISDKEDVQKVYVLVIGETARSMNIALNGYERNTTPLLSQRKNLVSFTNMVTGWSWTRMSVPVIITRKKVQDKNIFFPEKSIVSLFSEAGFDTSWLSTQSPYGFHDSPVALHAREAKFVDFMNPADYRSPGLYDDVMLSSLKKLVSRGGKQFIVLHTLGSHFNYKDRYPDEFDVFRPSMKSDDVSLQDREAKTRLLNSYDNSILFTDFFLNQVIEIVDAQKIESAVFYISDHGEVLFDGECDKSGHGQHTEYDHLTGSFLWVSDSYREKNENKVQRAFAKKNAPLSTENIFHSLVGLAGLTYTDQEDAWDIFSNVWRTHPRYLQTGLDFDSSDRSEKCREIIPKK